MFKRSLLFLAALILLGSTGAQAIDHTRRLGLNYIVGPSFIVGGDGATDVSSVQPGVGAGLQYGLTRNFDVRFDYDYIDADLRTQAITFGGQWGFMPEREINPFVGAGLGFGKPFSGEGWDHFSLKLNGGLEKEVSSNIALAAVLGYQFVDGKSPFGSVHVIEPGIRLTYFF